MNWIDKLKSKGNDLANDKVLSEKEKSFINKMLKTVPPLLVLVFQAAITIYIFRKLGENLGFLEAIIIQLSVIIVMARQVLTKKG